MVISASRRTDIPALYASWFFNRLEAGYVLVRNPMVPSQVSRIALTFQAVDCFVFWSKNPKPFLSSLSKLDGYSYYFQYTLNAYGRDVEPALPSLQARLDTFQELSEKIGKERVIWRYDPIFISERYGVLYHLEQFERLLEQLAPYTERCVISFIDQVKQRNFNTWGIRGLSTDEMRSIARSFSKCAKDTGLSLETCAEVIDLDEFGILHGRCIDDELIQRICSKQVDAKKDVGQRKACGCVKSVDIGAYDTCSLGCVYCYATHENRPRKVFHDVASPLLCSTLHEGDRVFERRESKQLYLDL